MGATDQCQVKVNLPIFKEIQGCSNIPLMVMGCGHLPSTWMGHQPLLPLHLSLTVGIPWQFS